MAVIETTEMCYMECESCRTRTLLRPVEIEDETYYVCEDCTPKHMHDTIW